MTHPTGYICSECNLPVNVMDDGTILRPCTHKGVVYMLLDCTLHGESDAGDQKITYEAFKGLGELLLKRNY
jgi:hypothetical protein